MLFAQPGAGLLTHPGGVIGGLFPFGWVTLPPESAPDDCSWPVESLGLFAEAPDVSSGVPWVVEEPGEDPWVVEEPGEGPVEAVVGDEAVVVVDGLVPEPVDEEAVVVVVPAVVVELPEEAAIVVAEPSSGAEAAGAEAVPTGEAGEPAPRALGALTAAVFTKEGGAGFEDGTTVLAAPVGGGPPGAAPLAPGCAASWVGLARGSAMPDTNG